MKRYQAVLFGSFAMALGAMHATYPYIFLKWSHSRIPLGPYAKHLVVWGFVFLGLSFVFQIFRLSARFPKACKFDVALKVGSATAILSGFLAALAMDLGVYFIPMGLVLLIIALATGYESVIRIKPGHVGHRERLGRSFDVLPSGLHLVVPFIDRVTQRAESGDNQAEQRTYSRVE